MDQSDFILNNLGINIDSLGTIFTFVDFGNVNHWYDKDKTPFSDGRIIQPSERVITDIKKLGSFIDLFSKKKYFYYGIDLKNPSSIHIKALAEKQARFVTVSKPIQRIKHYIVDNDFFDQQKLPFREDVDGKFIYIQKCNFDVELTIDALRLVENYDAFALFSSDRDFIRLLNFLKSRDKKIILFYSGPTSSELKNGADLRVNGQQIREIIGMIK